MKHHASSERPAHRLTPRMLQDFLTCPERFRVEHEMSLRANRPSWPWPLSVRDAVAEMLAARDQAACKGASTRDAASRALATYLNLARSASRPGAQRESSEAEAQMNRVRVEAAGIVENYEHAYSRVPFQGNGLRVAVGRKRRAVCAEIVERKLPTWSAKGEGRAGSWTYAPRIDLLSQGDGGVHLVVRVFTTSTEMGKVIRDLGHSTQWMGHAWAAQVLTRQPVLSIVYDVVRTKAPAVPGTVICRACKGTGFIETSRKGKLWGLTGTIAQAAAAQTAIEAMRVECEACNATGVGGISRAACDTEAWVLEREIARHGYLVDERERHRDALAQLHASPSSFVCRVLFPLRAGQVEAWLANAAQVVQQIGACRKRGAWPRNPYACADRGRSCPHAGPCADPAAFREVAFYSKVEFPYPGYPPWV